MADAYYVLSDPIRRREYDLLLRSRPSAARSSDPRSSDNFFSEFASYFNKARTSQDKAKHSHPGSAGFEPEEEDEDGMPMGEGWGAAGGPTRPDPNEQFGGVFEELLRPEIEGRWSMLSYLGAASGAVMGYVLPFHLSGRLTLIFIW